MELKEIQKADLGRKYARVDRRPLDPPPVVHLRLFRVENAGTTSETEAELAYDDVQVLGFLCTVDLFPVPGPTESLPPIQGNSDRSQQRTSAPATRRNFQSASAGASPSSTTSSSSPTYSTSPETHARPYIPANGSGSSYAPYQEQTSPSSPSGPQSPAQPNVVHTVGDYPITEDSKQTQALVGATFVQPAVVDYQGAKAIVFVFSDLAVKIEGTFILRYRMFDIFSRPFTQQNDLAITAETYGGPFRVYSTKEFPGLAASTELTKHLARWGVRLNIRETERRRRKRPADGRRSPVSDDDD
ncbi:unnamed protein product [Cyclocybe aegerita]|uniref:Velvet domain-containing protein n=1 Tax=Cyclocybe aegerita TaxID=1973307 RepID=A0A8S0W7R5_CYCAE|nr:unnamed protein product [Cyclocybe aegerita]